MRNLKVCMRNALVLFVLHALWSGCASRPAGGGGEAFSAFWYHESKEQKHALEVLYAHTRPDVVWHLYSLHPQNFALDERWEEVPRFHGYPILGVVTELSPREQERLASALRVSILANEGIVAACFVPAHGLRLELNGRQVEFLICFTCQSAYLYEGGDRTNFLLAPHGWAVFDDILTSHGIDVAE